MNRSATLAPPRIDAPLCRYVDLDGHIDAEAEGVLSGDERTRADAFRFAADRRRFMASHIALRHALAEHTGLRAATLHFDVAAHGKPSLAQRPHTQFSLSHSQSLALIAVGERGPLGADVEQLRAVPDLMDLAARHFTRRENAALAALPARERERAFLVCWTRKEACLKALGFGLLLAPESFEVGIVEDRRSVELLANGRIQWLLLAPAPSRLDSVGALAEWRRPEPVTQTDDEHSEAHA